ncbi:hypothetical protein [Streptomyces sp. NPDC096153]
MRAQDLAEPCPFVATDDDTLVTARTPAEQRLPALLGSTRTDSPTP